MKATIAQKAPYPITVEAGKTYYWCSCGKSKNQPFCDGSHQGSKFTLSNWLRLNPRLFTSVAAKTLRMECSVTEVIILCKDY